MILPAKRHFGPPKYVILYFPMTGEVLRIYWNLDNDEAGRFTVKANERDGPDVWHRLHKRFPNDSIRIEGDRSGSVDYATLRAACDFISDRSIASYAFWPSSRYNPELRARWPDGKLMGPWQARLTGDPNYK